MRITARQREAIIFAVREEFGDGAEVRLFGSRADDSKKGGRNLVLKLSNGIGTEQPEWCRPGRHRPADVPHRCDETRSQQDCV